MLTHTGRCFTVSGSQVALSLRRPSFRSCASRACSTGSARDAASGTTSRSGRRPRENRMYHAAYESAAWAVSRIPQVGQARSRFSPSSSSTGGSFKSAGTGPHSCGPAAVPCCSHARRDRALQAPTRSTRAESASGFAPAALRNAAARTSAPSAVSSTARTQSVSCAAKWGDACARSERSRYARPSMSHPRPSVESWATRAHSAAAESGGGGLANWGAWRSAASERAL